jgi:hypothetical protein
MHAFDRAAWRKQQALLVASIRAHSHRQTKSTQPNELHLQYNLTNSTTRSNKEKNLDRIFQRSIEGIDQPARSDTNDAKDQHAGAPRNRLGLLPMQNLQSGPRRREVRRCDKLLRQMREVPASGSDDRRNRLYSLSAGRRRSERQGPRRENLPSRPAAGLGLQHLPLLQRRHTYQHHSKYLYEQRLWQSSLGEG